SRVFRCSYGETVQIVGLSGEKPGNLGEHAYLIFNIKGNPSFFHCVIHSHALLPLTIHDHLFQSSARLDHRVDHFFRIDDKFDQCRCLCIFLSFFKRCRNIFFLHDTDSFRAITLCQLHEIRRVLRHLLSVRPAVPSACTQVCHTVTLTIEELLPLAHHAEILVIEHTKDKRQLLKHCCSKLLNIHLHTAVS